MNVHPKYSNSMKDATYRRDEYEEVASGWRAAEAPGLVLNSTANNSVLWGMDVVNWMLLLVRLAATI